MFAEPDITLDNPLNLCLFNAIYVATNQLANYPLGRYRSTFYEYFLSDRSISTDLSISINASTTHQLDQCLNSFIEHHCDENSSCLQFSQSAKRIFVEQQTTSTDPSMLASANTLRSLGDKKLMRYREQVLLWFKPICDLLKTYSKKVASIKINEHLLQQRLMPMTRSTFIRELIELSHNKLTNIPDLALLYRVYAESGTKIPLSDWFEVNK